MELTDAVVAVTGVARGIGCAVAEAAAAGGARVGLESDHDRAGTRRTFAEELGERWS